MGTGRFASADNTRDGGRTPGVRVAGMRSTAPQASVRRMAEKRARRHRERAVAEWLRSLNR